MVASMIPIQRAAATAANDQIDEIAACPIAGGVQRRLLPGNVTYRQWATDSNICARSYIEGYNRWLFPMSVGFVDLSITAADLGAHVRMDTENTPFVDEHIIHSMEDYERIQCPDVSKGRTGHLIETTRKMVPELRGKSVVSGFLEGPLLTLSQSAGAERLFMDMFTDPAPVHKALEQTTKMCCDVVDKMAETGIQAMTWDYLWGNYSVLGDAEYAEFEGDKYAKATNEATKRNGLGLGAHNCGDLPHLETQIRKFGTNTYSVAYYPEIQGSLPMAEIIDRGYADDCTLMGNLDPQIFMRNTYEQVYEKTKGLCQEVKAALCRRGLNSHFVLSTGCEIPPDLNCRIENIDAVVEATHKYGRMEY